MAETCISCGFIEAAPVLSKQLGDQTIYLDQCLDCRLVYLRGWSPEFKAELYDYYQTEYVPCELNRVRYLERIRYFEARLARRKIELLDLGCGAGDWVLEAQKHGWESMGIDLSKPAIALACARGANCFEMDIFSREFDSRRFDLITMDELIEHVAKPAEILKRVEKLLKPGGMLFLTTPNWGSLTRRMVGSAWAPIHPEHLSYFTPRTLGSLLSKSTKLHAERLRTQNLDILAIMNHYRGGNHEQGVPKAQLRERVENSAVLRAAKQVMNCFLHVSNMGDTIHFLGVKK